MSARHEQYKKPAPTGYLVYVYTVHTVHSVRLSEELTTVTTSKTRVADLAGATLMVAAKLNSFSEMQRYAVMKDWLQSIADHKTPAVIVRGKSGGNDITNEFWYEPYTDQEKAEIEEGGGVGTRTRRSQVCVECGLTEDECECDDEEDED